MLQTPHFPSSGTGDSGPAGTSGRWSAELQRSRVALYVPRAVIGSPDSFDPIAGSLRGWKMSETTKHG